MYEKIINEIKLNLGENKDLNKKYLSSQMEKYKDHEFNVEILRELSRMMWDCLSDEEKQEFIEISQNETPFNFTILTADTHFTDGYLDKSCSTVFTDPYANSFYCSDSMIGEFISWIILDR